MLNYGKSLPVKERVQGEFPVYGSNGIVGTHNEALVGEPGIVIGRKGSAGHVHLSPEPFCPIDTTFFITAHDAPEVDLRFLYFLLRHAGLKGIQDAGSVPGLSREIAYMEKVLFPLSRKEQQRIAACLSSLDELISAHSLKLDSLGDYKKGLMQQLFPQEGEAVPRLRFPEFWDDGEWIPGKLGDVLVLNYGKSLPVKERVQGEFPVYGSNGIVGTHNEALVGEPGIVIGRKGSAGHVHLSPEPFCPIDTTFFITAHDAPEVDLRFLYFLLRHAGLKGIQDAGSVPGLSREIAYMEKVLFPLSRKEQQRIAACLSSLDELISAQSRRLDALRTHKKGLMQQLFPAAGEVWR